MPVGKALKWTRHRITVERGSALRGLFLATAAAAPAAADVMEEISIDIPDLGDHKTPIDKADFLLKVAAEIEHALLAQYLYAAYSLKAPDVFSDSVQQQAVATWRRHIKSIAKEEMGHLMTVQNLRLVLGRSPYFERDRFPPPVDIYPFKLGLEPLTQCSLAKYVVAESPVDATAIEEIIEQATGAAGMKINRVGVLYGLLGVVFTREGELDANAAGGDPWYAVVRQLGYLAFAQQPPASMWHLPDPAFDFTAPERQAKDGWEQKSDEVSISVHRVTTRKETLEALRDIGIQGEGPVQMEGLPSHFQRFLGIYRGNGVPAFPSEGQWEPAFAVPINPTISDNASDPNAISHPVAQNWARLADMRYLLLMGFLEQFLHASGPERPMITGWSLGLMADIEKLANRLVNLPRTEGGKEPAALPFTLPEDAVPLPDGRDTQWSVHIARLEAAVALEEAMLAVQDDELLGGMIEKDRERLQRAREIKTAADMMGLLQSKQSIAQSVHSGIGAGQGSLSDLFQSENYAGILEFLRTSKSSREPTMGKDLIIPGDPENSAFFTQITTGVMQDQFTEADLKVVRTWINSLPGEEPMNRPTSFKLHIGPMFSQIDVSHMSFRMDLSDHASVKQFSASILNRLKGQGSLMPPADDGGPWPNEWIALFERWIGEGHPE